MPVDPRFARVHTDPRFHRPRRDETKVALDDRFKDVLTSHGTTQRDRFGRKRRVNEAQDLQRMYRLEGVDYARGEMELESSSEEEDEDESEDEDEDKDDSESGDVIVGGREAVEKAQDYDSDAFIDLDEDLDEEVMAQLDQQAKTQREDDIVRGDDTRRLAVVNMDWDHVRAIDLYKVFSSVVSPEATRAPLQASEGHTSLTAAHGQVVSVRIYLSDFGRNRLQREDTHGPPRAIFQGKQKKSTHRTIDEGSEFDEDALRNYQLERLRYYYAVATFDSAQSARHVYNEIDGTEMERSANMFDLRFVPDDMELPDGEGGRPAEYTDEATSDAGLAPYEGLDYKTDALRHSKVKLTWDQDDPRRTKLTKARAKGELREDELQTYLASSDEDEGEQHASRNRLRALLTDLPKKSAFDDADDQDTMYTKPDGDMEISFVPALQKHDDVGEKEETTLEKYMRKQREKREKRRQRAKEAAEEAAAASGSGSGDDDGDDGDNGDDGASDASDEHHFHLEDIVRAEKLQGKKLSRQQRKREARRAAKRQSLTQPSFVMNTHDPRFAAVMEDHRFAIDPSHPGFIKTAGMQQLINEGNKRRQSAADAKANSATPDVKSLVSSVKAKASKPPKKNRKT